MLRTLWIKAGRTFTIGVLSLSTVWLIRPEGAIADGQNCNIFGCSESPGVECNPFGCPNPGAGECTPSGCPEASTPKRNHSSSSDRNRSSDRDDNRVAVPSPDFASRVFKVRGETCPSGSTLVTPAEARGNLYDAVQKLDRWDIARLANGGSVGGLGYGSKVQTRDDRQLGNALCKSL